MTGVGLGSDCQGSGRGWAGQGSEGHQRGGTGV